MMYWKELLESSGGKLELTKCFYYILSWKFDEEGNATTTTKEQQRNIYTQIRIHDKANNAQTLIVQKEVSKAHKTLGCFK